MSPSGHLVILGRSVRILRLVAALAVTIGVVAVAAVLKGDDSGRSLALIALSVLLGAVALLGMALAAWPYMKKEKNDPRS